VPFTLAHPAAVLPLRRAGLPMVALVVGSMVPDARLFVPWLPSYDTSHSPAGIVTVDLALAMACLALWTYVVRDALVDVAPAAARERLDPQARLSPRAWALAVPAAVVGSATHVGWDAFTHADRWGTRHVAWLREEHWFWPGYTWAQAASGGLGLLVVAAAALAWLRTRPRAPHAHGSLLPRTTPAAVAVLQRRTAGVEQAAYHCVVSTIRVGVVATVAVCAAWWLMRAARTLRPSLDA
jgi:hypothetical protein